MYIMIYNNIWYIINFTHFFLFGILSDFPLYFCYLLLEFILSMLLYKQSLIYIYIYIYIYLINFYQSIATLLFPQRREYSSILAWKIPWTEEPGRLQSMGSQGQDTIQRLNHHLAALQCRASFHYITKCINYKHTYISSFSQFPSHLCHHRALSRVSCTIQQVLIRSLFYTQYQCVYILISVCIYINPNFPIHLTPLFPLGVHIFFSFCLCLYF